MPEEKKCCPQCGTETSDGKLCRDCSSSTDDLINEIKKKPSFGKGRRN